MQNLLDLLNPEQIAAVTLPSQSALILAGAGSGKTRVLTTRIAWLMKTGQIAPDGVLAVTFTNKAAREVVSRVNSLIPFDAHSMWIGTFHGLCHRLLRTHYRDAALPPSFHILDVPAQLSLIKRLLKRHGIHEEHYPPRDILHHINRAKEKGLRAGDEAGSDDYSRGLSEVYALYEAQCQREGAVDFAELLLRSYELLSRNQPLRTHYQTRFRHILVDEFQDTNDLQYRWLRLIAESGAAIFAVGDDDQSIYAFRGANVGNMFAFQQDFRVQHIIRLEQNYRSHGNILSAANELIAHNSNRLGKNLYTDAALGEPVRVMALASDWEEAQYLVEEVRQLARDGIALRDMAILYRANAQSRVIEHAFFGANIPYRVHGGLRFFERVEIRHAMAYLQLMDNPHNDSAFLRVVNFPSRGIGLRSIEQLQACAQQHDVSLYAAIPLLPGRPGKALQAFFSLIEEMRAALHTLPLPRVVEEVIGQSALKAHYQSEKGGADRVENLAQLSGAAALFLAEENIPQDTPALFVARAQAESAPASGVPGEGVSDTYSVEVSPLAAFLTHASLESGEGQAVEGEDALQMMTVHSAKGLEFSVVFITGLEEGLFPHENSAGEEKGLEEERRLMYVAITRARHRLYLSYAQTRSLHGSMRYHIRSRFLGELPASAMQWSKKSNDNAVAYQPSQSASLPVQQAAALPHAEWRIGETVRHPKFGEGVIVRLEGWGSNNPSAHIHFGRQGTKQLDLTVAKLEHAG
ncbi:MAG: UvrD-helicase domain-containing protein [Burkholderiaceae bacterium]|jgi:DNA helicase-2/ATP-dependent DNA helicase PcrA|nr:UvrD-helicase domain-containing protein [Burkholderiaceae bacterium]